MNKNYAGDREVSTAPMAVPAARQMWRYGILLGLLLAIAGSFSSSHAQVTQIACGEHEAHCLFSGSFSAVSVAANPRLPGSTAVNTPYHGALIYADYKELESNARALLTKGMQMRLSISPYRDNNDFDTYLRNLDFEAGWSEPYGGDTPYADGLTFQALVDAVEADLVAALNIYAYLAVFAPESRFRADSNYTASLCGVTDQEDPNPPASTPGQVFDPIIDWCNFRARLRQSIREIANIRMIVGQEFMVDALGVNFSADTEGGEELVREEVAQLNAALFQFETTERFLTSALTHVVGNGCTVSDFYMRDEWALLSRTLELQGSVQYQIATRLSYLGADSAASVQRAKTDALDTFRQSANDGYINLLMLAGAGVSEDSGCALGERPDGPDIESLSINVLDAQQKAQELAENRNIFGFDVEITPARRFKSSIALPCDTNPEADRGLYDQAKCLAEEAADLQERAENKTRLFEESQGNLLAALGHIRGDLDTDIDNMSGCNRADLPIDEDYNDCVELQIALIEECLALAGQPGPSFDACVQQDAFLKGPESESALLELRSLYGEWEAIFKAMVNLNARIQESKDANATVQHWLLTSGSAESLARASQAALDGIACVDLTNPLTGLFEGSICGTAATLNTLAQAAAGALSTKANIEIAGAENQKEVENLLLDQSELLIAADAAHRAFLAKQSAVQGLLGVLQRIFAETKRQRAYFITLPANDPSFRIVRDSARLELAEALEKAAKFAYLAARRAEYEYAARLYKSGFRISDIYRARTAQDILKFLTDLQIKTNLMAGSANADTNAIDFKVSIAQHVLHLTDAALQAKGHTTPEAIAQARAQEFQKWVAEHTLPNIFEEPFDKKAVLVFTMTTSLLPQGLYANVIPQGYDRYWRFTLSGIGSPKPTSNGVSINLLSNQPGVSYQKAVMRQGGLVHMRSQAGCYFDYKLMAPAALLGLEWAENQNPEEVEQLFSANVNGTHAYTENGFRTPGFDGRPISGTGWQIMIFAGSPDNILPDMDLQQLTDIELNLSAVYSSRTPGIPGTV